MIATRVTEATASALYHHASAAGLSVSAYLDRWAADRPPVCIPAINQYAWERLARTAANLNQLTHHCNSAALLGEKPELRALPATLADLRRDVTELRAAMVGRQM